MITGKDVFVTGRAGFIGRYAVERLAERNETTVLDDFASGSEALLPDRDWTSLVEGNVTDAEPVERPVSDADVVHLASVMGVRRTLERPTDIVR